MNVTCQAVLPSTQEMQGDKQACADFPPAESLVRVMGANYHLRASCIKR